MNKFKKLATHSGRSGSYLHAHLDRVEDWPSELSIPSPHFVLFLALDARAIDTRAIATLAARALEQGLAYLVAWGFDCQRVEDIFDHVIVERTLELSDHPERCVLTTSHPNESLADAIEFFAHSAVPDESEWRCETWLAASVAEPSWSDEIQDVLQTPM